VAVLVDALRRIDEGECVVDPTIVLATGRAATGETIDYHRRVLGVLAYLRR
jgi:hypothetical protein